MSERAYKNLRLRECGLFLLRPELHSYKVLDSTPFPEFRRYILFETVIKMEKYKYVIIDVYYSGEYKIVKETEGGKIDTKVLLYG